MWEMAEQCAKNRGRATRRDYIRGAGGFASEAILAGIVAESRDFTGPAPGAIVGNAAGVGLSL